MYSQNKLPVTDEEIKASAKELGLSDHALKVLEKRNLRRNENGEIIETPGEMFRRTAQVIAEVEKDFGTDPEEIKQVEQDFYEMMYKLEFIANRQLKNAGREYPFQQFAACYVFPVEDDLDNIFTTLEKAAFIQKWDAAAGIDYSTLRPRNDVVGSTGGRSSGAVSFMTLFDKVSEVISEGSLRRGANMGVLRIDHPDVEEFIHAKKTPGVLEYFNVSIGMTDKFMNAVENDDDFDLINPRTGRVAKTLKARDLWNQIVNSAWESAEPGLIFLDEIERQNKTPHVGKMTAVNLCGEQPLLPWESCNLGNIVLTKVLKEENGVKEIDWEKLEKIVKLGVRFLDNSVEAHHYFFKEIEDVVRNGNRKIGLGIMGFADMLIELGIGYNTDEGVALGEKVMKFINEKAIEASGELARKRGNFGNYKGSVWEKWGVKYMRNACVTTVAPTGSASVIADSSSGVEPVFAFAYTRYGLGQDVKHKDKMFYINERLLQALKDHWVYSKELVEEIIDKGSIQNIDVIPDSIKKVFVCAMDIEPTWHIKMQAAFQKHVDSAITKTVNMPHSAQVKDVEDAYFQAWKSKCKGITVYRDQSRHEQVLTIGKRSNYTAENQPQENVEIKSEATAS